MKDWHETAWFYKKYPYKLRTIGDRNKHSYVKKSEEIEHEYSLKYKDWLLIINTFFEFKLQELIDKGRMYLPYLGLFRLIKRKLKYVKSDNKIFKNIHSDNYTLYLIWHRKTCEIADVNIWTAKLIRAASKKAHKEIISNNRLYYFDDK